MVKSEIMLLKGNIVMKYCFVFAVLLFATPAFSYGDYNNYTVVGNDRNSTGYIQQIGNSYYGTNGVSYTQIGDGRFTSNTGSTYEKHGNIIQELNGKRYVQMGNMLYEE